VLDYIYDMEAEQYSFVRVPKILTDEDFGSLTPDQMKAFEEKFHSPEVFIWMGRGIMAVPLPDEKVEKQQEKKVDAPELKPHKKVKEESGPCGQNALGKLCTPCKGRP